MDEAKTDWQGRAMNQLQGPSSLGMALSGGAVGFSTSILTTDAYVGFWTSMAFQMHAGLQFLSVAAGVAFILCRLKRNDVGFMLRSAQRDNAPAHEVEQLGRRLHRLTTITRLSIYAQIALLSAGGVSFLWLMILHFQRALYP